MAKPYVVLDRIEVSGVSNERLLAELRRAPPGFVREAIEAELLRRLDAWAMGLEHG